METPIVFVVDDEPGIALLCNRLLTRAGYKVEIQTSPREAINYLKDYPYACNEQISSRLFASLSVLEVMKKYTELWDPTRFVTIDQVQKMIDEIKHHRAEEKTEKRGKK